MKIYQASLNIRTLNKFNELFPCRKINVLISYGVLSRETYEMLFFHHDKILSLLMDSGTWTLNKARNATGHIINRENYGNYVLKVKDRLDYYASFDSDFSTNGSEINIEHLHALEKMGLNPFPVVHDIYGTEIDYYIDCGYKMVALCSFQIRTVDDLDFVMNKFKGTGIKIHLFGHTKFDLISNFPLYSCDSAAWAHTGAFGYIHYWNPKKEGVNKLDRIYMEEYLSTDDKGVTFTNYEFRNDLEEFLASKLKLTHFDLVGTQAAYNKMLVNTYYYVQLEDIINEIHRKKGFI
jgi:hypothetical protein